MNCSIITLWGSWLWMLMAMWIESVTPRSLFAFWFVFIRKYWIIKNFYNRVIFDWRWCRDLRPILICNQWKFLTIRDVFWVREKHKVTKISWDMDGSKYVLRMYYFQLPPIQNRRFEKEYYDSNILNVQLLGIRCVFFHILCS